ncbi:hypothetical protein PMI18_02823, partial [Pseudomonas sp. GM102]
MATGRTTSVPFLKLRMSMIVPTL